MPMLGAQYTPLFVGSANNHPAMPGFRAPEELQPAVEPDRLQGRRHLLDNVSSPPASPATRDWQDIQRRAFDLANGGRQAFELHREPAAVRSRYGMHPL